MKLLFSIFINLLKISWKIIKFLSKPMWGSIKDLWKASWNFYKERKAEKAASICDSAENASLPVKGLDEPKESLNVGDSESSNGRQS